MQINAAISKLEYVWNSYNSISGNNCGSRFDNATIVKHISHWLNYIWHCLSSDAVVII